MNPLFYGFLIAWSLWALISGTAIGSNKSGQIIKGWKAILLASNPFTYVGVFIGAFING